MQWLLNHPEVFEKLAFAKASGKNTLAVLRNIWVKEGKELSGVGLNMALGAALISTSREPEACEARYDFTKSLLRRKNFFRSSLRWNRGNSAFFSGAGKVLRSLPGHRITWLAKRRSRAGNAGYACCGLIPYRMKNKQGISVHAGGAFYDHKPISLQIYVEYGGCVRRRFQRGGRVCEGEGGFLPTRSASQGIAPLCGRGQTENGR